MKEPKKIKLTDSPTSKAVNLTPLPSKNNYPENMDDDIYIKQNNEDNKQNNSQSISELESL